MDNLAGDYEIVSYEACTVNLWKNLAERNLGCSKKNLQIKEAFDLYAEELLVKKERFDELHCEMPGSPRSTFLMVFSPDGTKVASTHGNHNIYVTDIRSGKNLKTLVGHPRTPWCIAFHPTSNQIIASGCLGGQVRIWDLSGGSEVWTARNQTVIASIAFHPLERVLAIATSNEVHFWDWSKPEPFLQTSTGIHKEKVRYVSFDKLGQRLITGISNHYRWDSVRSPERTSDPAIRHFGLGSRRPPMFRREVVPRPSVPVPSSSNQPTDFASRIPERERNITVSYRNLVRQYGRLVQRYLQLYRPPAMVDRGTDPMEVTAAANNISENDGPSNSAGTLRNPRNDQLIRNPTRNEEPLATSVSPPGTVIPSRKHKIDSLPPSDISQKRQKLNDDDNDGVNENQSSLGSESPQPGPSGLSNSPQLNQIHELSRAIITTIANFSKTTSNAQTDRTDGSNSDTTFRSSSPQPGPSGLSNTKRHVGEVSRGVIASIANLSETISDTQVEDANDIKPNINSITSARTESPLESDENEIEFDATRISDDRDSETNVSYEDVPTDQESNRTNVNHSSNEQPIEHSDSNSQDHRDEETSINQTPPDNSSDNYPSGADIDSRVDNLFGLIAEASRSNEIIHELDIDEALSHFFNDSGDSLRHYNVRRETLLERVMMIFRGRAEDNLMSAITPVIEQRAPPGESGEFFRVLHRSLTESRMRAHQRYSVLVNNLMRQHQSHVFMPSDTSSSDDERDPLHINFYSRRGDESGTSFSRTRRNGHPSLTHNYYDGRLLNWIARLYNDYAPSNTNMNGRDTDGMRPSTYRSPSDNNSPRRNLDSSSPESIVEQEEPDHSSNTTSTSSQNDTPLMRLLNRFAYSSVGIVPDFSRGPISSVRPPRNPRRREVELLNRLMTNSSDRDDEVIDFSELLGSDVPSTRYQQSLSPPRGSFHTFNPPPNLPTINPENIGIGNMYSYVIHDLEASLNDARITRILDRPGEMSNMLSNFSNRLEALMNQSEEILRNLRTSVEVISDNDSAEYGEEPQVPTASFNDSSFFVRDQGYDILTNNATSDHTYPRNSDSPSAFSNNLNMSLMNSLQRTLSHIQIQSGVLHRHVESIERIDQAMVEISQLQLMRLLLGELDTYVRCLSGQSRSTSMSSVRQMMAGTRISDSNPGITLSNEDSESSSIINPSPSTSTGARSSNQSQSARSRGHYRKTYPPSRLHRPSGEHSGDSLPPEPTTRTFTSEIFSEINLVNLARIERRLHFMLDQQATRFSFHTDPRNNFVQRINPNDDREYNVAVRLRESMSRINRLIGNIFNPNVLRNYRINATSSLRHGMNRMSERITLSYLIDGFSSHLFENRDQQISNDVRSRLLSVLHVAMLLADLFLYYTLVVLSPTSEVNLDSEIRLLALRIEEACSALINRRRISSDLMLSLRSLRLLVSNQGDSSNLTRAMHIRRERLVRAMRERNSGNNPTPVSETQNRGDSTQTEGRHSRGTNPLIDACLFLARRDREDQQSTTNLLNESNNHLSRTTRRLNRVRSLMGSVLLLNRQERALHASQAGDTDSSLVDDIGVNFRTTARRNLNLDQSNQSPISESESTSALNRQSPLNENRRNRYGFNPYRDMELITTRSTGPPSLAPNRDNDSAARNVINRSRRIRALHNQAMGTYRNSPDIPLLGIQRLPTNSNESMRNSPAASPTVDAFDDVEIWSRQPVSYVNESPRRARFRIPAVQVNDVPINERVSPDVVMADQVIPFESLVSDNSGQGAHQNDPRVMARLAAFRRHILPVYRPMGMFRPRFLHPIYSSWNPFDSDAEPPRDLVYENDVISAITPNHRIQVWDMTSVAIPIISDPTRNVVVGECKIHNDASVDMASDGSILVTLLPSGGYVNITNRLGVYSLRWETLGQCLYTTSFEHNAVSVSLSPLGKHLVVALATRRVSLLPNDTWMMASIYKMDEKDDHDHLEAELPCVMKIERGRSNEPLNHKSVNCIRWLPTSGQGLIYATNTGQLNIWT